MVRGIGTVTVVTCLIGTSSALAGGWVEYVDDTANRMPAALNDPNTSLNDDQEKDYIWGDVDKDGDIDLICVRKLPFTFDGGRANVLWLNEGTDEGHAINGVLVDHSDMVTTMQGEPGDGFADQTNDRDVVLADVDGDTWLDMITATTLHHGEAKWISHPRVYMNLGEQGGVWQGFEYQPDRIPQLYTLNGQGNDVNAVAPLFCSVDAGDLTGDGRPELYFGDYDGSGGGGEQEPPNSDLDDKMLVNDGSGNFSDSRYNYMTANMLSSAFGTAVEIADINQDGWNDVARSSGLNSPLITSVAHNDPDDVGNFKEGDFKVVYPNRAPYFVEVGHLNDDGRLDIVITDDGLDAFMINQGNDAQGNSTWTITNLPNVSNDFGSNIVIDDLDKDGRNDILIADVDVDIPGCNRRTHIYRNLGGDPPSFAEQGQIIPNSALTGTHDLAVFDLNGDTWLDIVVGTCNGTKVYMNVAPQGLIYFYPDGLPASVTPDTETQFEVEISGFGGAQQVAGSGQQHVSVNGGAFVTTSMTDLGNDTYLATLPAAECTAELAYYFTVDAQGGGTFFDPASAPAVPYSAVSADGTEITRDEIEDDVSGWTITDDASLTSGTWEQADPNGTLSGGNLANPEDDATNGAANTKCFVTQNGPVGGGATADDVDGGPTTLTSPVYDLAGTDGQFAVSLWAFNDDQGNSGEDTLRTEVSNGGPWVEVTELARVNTGSVWESVFFTVSDYVAPTATVQVRFIADDSPNNSVTEAGVDNLQLTKIICDDEPVFCDGDTDEDGDVDVTDLLTLLSGWGPCVGCPGDSDGDDDIDVSDLLTLLSNWGTCP